MILLFLKISQMSQSPPPHRFLSTCLALLSITASFSCSAGDQPPPQPASAPKSTAAVEDGAKFNRILTGVIKSVDPDQRVLTVELDKSHNSAEGAVVTVLVKPDAHIEARGEEGHEGLVEHQGASEALSDAETGTQVIVSGQQGAEGVFVANSMVLRIACTGGGGCLVKDCHRKSRKCGKTPCMCKKK